jgi:hypothetical protein
MSPTTMLDFTPAQSRAYDATLERERREPDAWCVACAEMELLRTPSFFADWLVKLMPEEEVTIGYVPIRTAGELSDKFYVWLQDRAQAHELMVLALNHRAWADVAMGRLADMFVQDHAARIQKRAMEVSDE